MAAGFPNIFEQQGSAVEVKKNEKDKSKRARSVHRCKSCSAAAPEEPNAARSPVAMGVVVATSLYCGVKAGIQVRSCPMPSITRGICRASTDLNQQVVSRPKCCVLLLLGICQSPLQQTASLSLCVDLSSSCFRVCAGLSALAQAQPSPLGEASSSRCSGPNS